MRGLGITIFSFAALLSGLGCYSYGEYAEPIFVFSLAYQCGAEENGKKTETLCLADSFKKELDVVLVTAKSHCSARTGDTFADELATGGQEFKATHLKGTENCHLEDKFSVAVVGVNPSRVNFVDATSDKSPLSKEVELKAREVARSGYQNLAESADPEVNVADSPPDLFRVGNTAFLLFRSTEEFLNEDGLPVLVLNDNAFLLQGTCAFGPPFFFTVKEKLHVSYWATVSCCGCGDSNFFVYDVSGESPKLVYKNSDFSD